MASGDRIPGGRIRARGFGQMKTWVQGETYNTAGNTKVWSDTPGSWFTVLWLQEPDHYSATARHLIMGEQHRPKFADTGSQIYDSGIVDYGTATPKYVIEHIDFQVGLGFTLDPGGPGALLEFRDAHALCEWRLAYTVDPSPPHGGGTYTAIDGFEQVKPNNVLGVKSGLPLSLIKTTEKGLRASLGLDTVLNSGTPYRTVAQLTSCLIGYPYALHSTVGEPYELNFTRTKIPNFALTNDPIDELAVNSVNRLVVQARIPADFSGSSVGFEYDVDVFGYMEEV